MTASSYDDPPRRHARVEAIEVDGELVLYHPVSNRATALDARASAIWQVLDGTVTVAELVDDLSTVFDADPETVRGDVDAMLTELHSLGYLVSASEVDDAV